MCRVVLAITIIRFDILNFR